MAIAAATVCRDGGRTTRTNMAEAEAGAAKVREDEERMEEVAVEDRRSAVRVTEEATTT